MFKKVGQTLYLSRGDTGNLRVLIDSSYTTTNADRILFTIKDGNRPVIVRVVTPVDNVAIIRFTNEMTENLPPQTYRYDIRIFLNAVLEDGIPIDGDVVRTPFKEAKFELLDTVGDT